MFKFGLEYSHVSWHRHPVIFVQPLAAAAGNAQALSLVVFVQTQDISAHRTIAGLDTHFLFKRVFSTCPRSFCRVIRLSDFASPPDATTTLSRSLSRRALRVHAKVKNCLPCLFKLRRRERPVFSSHCPRNHNPVLHYPIKSSQLGIRHHVFGP
ncbi:hypothetical protein BDZ88DRAFT_422576 [Geranomyces variabilis]|nr:hypothetical protein BDZ88DRAFT_422576 [Geranomyces variabilis]